MLEGGVGVGGEKGGARDMRGVSASRNGSEERQEDKLIPLNHVSSPYVHV